MNFFFKIAVVIPAALVLICAVTFKDAAAQVMTEEQAAECRQKAASTLETSDCMMAEYNSLSKELDRVGAEAEAAATAGDAELPQYNQVALFRKSQDSFETYMKDQCDFVTATYTNGSFAGASGISCKNDLMRQRIKMITLN